MLNEMEFDSSFLAFLEELKNSYGKLILLAPFFDNVPETFLHISEWVRYMTQCTLLASLHQHFITVKKHKESVFYLKDSL